MKTFINFTTYFLILLGLYSCNGDVFVDDFRSSDSELTLDGNGDVATIRFASSNWDLFGLYNYDENFSHPYKVFDANGDLIMTDQIPYLKGLGKIVCDEELIGFTVDRSNPKELKITVDENARSTHFRLMLVVGNEYESQDIYVEISPSDRYVFDHITYSLNGYSHEWRLEETMSFIQSNNLGTPSPCLLFPYKDAHHEVVFKSDDPEAFRLLGGDNPTVEIPSMENEWLGMNGVQAQYTSEQQALPLPFPDTEKKEISIPPKTTQRIIVLLECEWFETEYTLYAVHPKTKKQRIITGTLQSKMPGKCYIARENIK